MSREEAVGMDLFGQNLFMAAPEEERVEDWIIEKTENGKTYQYLMRGIENSAKLAAEAMGGTYRKGERRK